MAILIFLFIIGVFLFAVCVGVYMMAVMGRDYLRGWKRLLCPPPAEPPASLEGVWPPPPRRLDVGPTHPPKREASLLAEVGWALAYTLNCLVLLPDVPAASGGAWAAFSHYGAWIVLPGMALTGWAKVARRLTIPLLSRRRGAV